MMTPLVQTRPFLLSRSVFVFLVFSSLIFCVIFSSTRQIKLAYVSLRTHVNIAYRIVWYRTGQKRVTVKKQGKTKMELFHPGNVRCPSSAVLASIEEVLTIVIAP